MSTWHQLVVSGNEKALRGFVAGFEAARGQRIEIAFGSDLGIAASSLATRVRDLLAPGASHHAIYASTATAGELVRALAARGQEVGLTVVNQSEVLGASFSFEAKTASPEIAQAIRGQVLAALPEGVEAVGVTISETHHPESRGAELYAPEHAFEFRAAGGFRGPFPGVVELHRRARSFEHITVSPLTLDTREG
ncbi:MAG: hypothetical protein HRF46_15225 [Acidobacteriota bacterium]|jgi:hypothetical protein